MYQWHTNTLKFMHAANDANDANAANADNAANAADAANPAGCVTLSVHAAYAVCCTTLAKNTFFMKPNKIATGKIRL
jgi:hypothetical protein